MINFRTASKHDRFQQRKKNGFPRYKLYLKKIINNKNLGAIIGTSLNYTHIEIL